jgi:DNA-cytosine methyltransferase
MDTSQTITHISLCAGYGGIDIGLKRAIPNLRTIAFSEIEAFACANLVSKMEKGLLDAAPIWTNLKTFPWAEFRGKVDILSGGYPCQPFSAAGKRLGTEDPRHLWPFIANGIRLMQPKLCFFENVEGHISLGLRAVIEELGSLGYKTTWGIFSASEVGAPHQRKRVFIMAHRKCAGLEGWSKSTKSATNKCRSSNNFSESSNLLVNSINNDGSDVSRIQHGETKQSIIGISSGDVADSNNSGSRQDQLLSKLRTTGIEQSSRCSRLSGESTKTREVTVWPSRPRQPQYEWEPSRVVGNAESGQDHGREPRNVGGEASQGQCGNNATDIAGEELGDTDCGGQSFSFDPRSSSKTISRGENIIEQTECGQTKPSLGGDADGSTRGLDYAELCVTCDNRTDELRLLGNGVVPATATRAFLMLINETI